MGLLRLTAAAAAASLGAWLLAVRGIGLAAEGLDRVDDVVALGAVATGGLVAAWYALTAAALALARAVLPTRRAPRLAGALATAVRRCGAPVLRRAAIVGAGAGIALGALPAAAGAPDDVVPHDLRPGLTATEPGSAGWDAPSSAPPADDGASEPAAVPPEPAPVVEETFGGVDPGRPTTAPAPAVGALPAASGSTVASSGGAAQDGAGRVGDAHGARRSDPSSEDTQDEDGRYVVRRGDSLWSVAAAHLGPDAGDPAIAAEWPRWYANNRAVVGTNPDLIHPGQVLQAPDPKDVP